MKLTDKNKELIKNIIINDKRIVSDNIIDKIIHTMEYNTDTLNNFFEYRYEDKILYQDDLELMLYDEFYYIDDYVCLEDNINSEKITIEESFELVILIIKELLTYEKFKDIKLWETDGEFYFIFSKNRTTTEERIQLMKKLRDRINSKD